MTRSVRRVVSGTAAAAAFAGLSWVCPAAGVAAPETVTIVLPGAVTFLVADVNNSTAGNPSPTPVAFMNANLKPNRVLRISVKADANFGPPAAGGAIPASNVSWTVSNVAGGFGTNGTLSSVAFGLLFQGQGNAVAGGLDVSWALAAPGPTVRAGVHAVSMRWRIESIMP
jgi:hypothetical protein